MPHYFKFQSLDAVAVIALCCLEDAYIFYLFSDSRFIFKLSIPECPSILILTKIINVT